MAGTRTVNNFDLLDMLGLKEKIEKDFSIHVQASMKKTPLHARHYIENLFEGNLDSEFENILKSLEDEPMAAMSCCMQIADPRSNQYFRKALELCNIGVSDVTQNPEKLKPIEDGFYAALNTINLNGIFDIMYGVTDLSGRGVSLKIVQRIVRRKLDRTIVDSVDDLECPDHPGSEFEEKYEIGKSGRLKSYTCGAEDCSERAYDCHICDGVVVGFMEYDANHPGDICRICYTVLKAKRVGPL